MRNARLASVGRARCRAPRSPWRTPRALLAAAVLATVAPAQDAAAALDRLLRDSRLSGARIGVVVVDLDRGQVLCSNDADAAFMPASNMKLISSAVALVTLGPDHQFRTVLRARGRYADGTLHGDLELVGSGDPTLGGRHEDSATAPFERFATVARKRGIERVTGRVIGDDDCQPDEILGDGWTWDDESAGYAAQLSGLCFAENSVRVLVRSAAAGQPPRIRLTPATSYLDVSCSADVREDKRTGPLKVERLHGRNEIHVSGAMPASTSLAKHVSVDNPTWYAAHVLRETLSAAGIEVEGPAADRDQLGRSATSSGREVALAELRSPPLADILVTLNKSSQNLYAEQLIRAASRHIGGGSDMDSAEKHAKTTLRGLGVNTKGLVIADGSGLTRLNLVRPRQLADLLAAMWRHQHRDVFVASLPISGVDGTLRGRLGGKTTRGKVRAKTGYIRHVVALSGYISTGNSSGQPLVFSVMINNFVCSTRAAKSAVDTFVKSLVPSRGD